MNPSAMHPNQHTRRIPRGETTAHALSPSATPPLVLIAEDDDDIRLTMKTLLEMKGYRTAEAANARKPSRPPSERAPTSSSSIRNCHASTASP